MRLQKLSLKKRASELLYFFPALIVLVVSLFALHSATVVMDENQILKNLYDASMSSKTINDSQIDQAKNIISKKNQLMYWSVWTLGLLGFALMLMNIDKFRRLNDANAKQQDALALLETQLEDIRKAEKDKAALQEQLSQAQKLEAVGRLAGGIAHDFNNILAAMNGYAEFLMDDLEQETPQHDFANNILKAGVQARDLVDKMLAFSRRDVNQIQEMYLAESIEETMSMLKASLPKSVEVEKDIQDEGYLISGSQTLISQALMNLCVNAKDAMPNEKGRLMVSLARADKNDFQNMKISKKLPENDDLPLIDIKDVSPMHTCLTMGKFVEGQDYMCLTVADSGSGMSRAIMENIFEPFFTTKPVDEGTGLGLAMVHGVIATHKGAMQINSIAGKGTRFDLLFPSLGEKEITEEKIEQQENWKAIGSVLVVDDQDDVRSVTQTMLERKGFEVEACDSGQAALEIIEEHPDYFNVIVTDHNMPQMTGIELIKKASKTHPGIPFVLVTGYSPDSMGDILNKNANLTAVIKKPVNREKLLQAVQDAIIERQFAC